MVASGNLWGKVGRHGRVVKSLMHSRYFGHHRLYPPNLHRTKVMFIGEHSHTIDEKGRLQVPVKWRSKLAGGAVVTKGFDGSLKFYPAEKWGEIAAKLTQLPQSQPQARAFVRQTLAGAVDVELDKMGRVLIPPYLREWATLSKHVVLAGLHDHVEIWGSDTWKKYQGELDVSSPDYYQTLKDIGI